MNNKKSLLKIVTIFFYLICSSNRTFAESPQYEYQTDFQVPDGKMKTFYSKESLENYLHSFGYASKHLINTSTESVPYTDYKSLTYEVDKKSSIFKGKQEKVLYGGASDPLIYGTKEMNSLSSPEEYLKKILGDDNNIMSETTNGWTYDGTTINVNVNNSYEYVFKASYQVTYAPKDYPKDVEHMNYDVYKYSNFDCSPPEPDNLIHDSVTYEPVKNKHDKSCIAQDNTLIAVAMEMPYQRADNQLCKDTKADPVDVISGKVYEHTTDYVVRSPNPIVIERYYNRGDDLWSFSYSRILDVSDADKIVTTRDNGDKLTFKKDENGNYISPQGVNSHMEKVVKDGNTFYVYTLPDGSSETYSQFGYLTSIRSVKGYITTVTVLPASNTLLTISDGFGHVVKAMINDNGTEIDYILPNNQKIIYHVGSGLKADIKSVEYPNGSKVSYEYQQSYLSTSSTDNHLPLMIKTLDAKGKTVSSWSYGSNNSAISNQIIR